MFINIKRNGMETYTIPSYLKQLLFTNNGAPIKIEDGARRYNMYDVDNNIGKGQDLIQYQKVLGKNIHRVKIIFMNYTILLKMIKILFICL